MSGVDFFEWHSEVSSEGRIRDAAVGPLASRAFVLREFAAAVRDLADLIAVLPVELELIDARLRTRFGERWWEDTTYSQWSDWRSGDD